MVKLKYQNGSSTAVTQTFRELSLVELPETERSQIVTLRKRRVDHLLAIWRVWSLTITTEAAVNDVLWVKDFWTAEQRWIQSPYSVNDENWIAVSTAPGRCPITFVENVIYFPEAGLELFAKEAS
jgi:hypothetical protein